MSVRASAAAMWLMVPDRETKVLQAIHMNVV